MLDALNITEAEAQGLTDIAALDLAMAKTFAARAQAAEDPDVAARMARSYHRCTRSYRQTLLLKSRLQRDLQRAMAEAPEPDPADAPRRPPIPPARFNRLGDRAMALIDAAKKVTWAEYDGLDGVDAEHPYFLADYLGELERWVAQAGVKPGFIERPLDDHVADLCRELGLDPDLSARWRDLPEPPEDAFHAPRPKPEPPPPTPPTLDDSGGYWFKPADWKPGDQWGYHRPPKPRPP